MDIRSRINEKLSKVIFLEIKKEALGKLLKCNVQNDIDLPVRSTKFIKGVKSGDKFEEIPVSYFVEGMFFVLGADQKFKYNDIYVKVLNCLENSLIIIKKVISEYIKNDNLFDSYILLSGLVTVQENEENYEKLIMVLDSLRYKNREFEPIEIENIKLSQQNVNLLSSYLYEASIDRSHNNYEDALISLEKYLQLGGKQDDRFKKFYEDVKGNAAYEKGIKLTESEPDRALKCLLPLVREPFDNASLLYYIAVSYRNLENYEKAIFYLNEAFKIDNNLVQVVNELGINYALLGNFNTAIKYLRTAFEATKSIEICTNLIMCYININDIKSAKVHLEIAEKLKADDEIVLKLKKILEEK